MISINKIIRNLQYKIQNNKKYIVILLIIFVIFVFLIFNNTFIDVLEKFILPIIILYATYTYQAIQTNILIQNQSKEKFQFKIENNKNLINQLLYLDNYFEILLFILKVDKEKTIKIDTNIKLQSSNKYLTTLFKYNSLLELILESRFKYKEIIYNFTYFVPNNIKNDLDNLFIKELSHQSFNYKQIKNIRSIIKNIIKKIYDDCNIDFYEYLKGSKKCSTQ